MLVGHSLGGYLSLEFALAHPDRVDGLVLVDTGPGYRNDEARAAWNEMAERYAADLEARGPRRPAGQCRARRRRALAAPTGWPSPPAASSRQDDGHVLESLPTIAVPTLVVVGENDEPFSSGSRYMAAKIPDADLVVIDGAAHAPPVTHPEEFNAALRSFLGRTVVHR